MPLLGLLYAFLLLNYHGPILLLGLHSCYFRLFLTHYIAYRLPWPISSSLGVFGLFPFLGYPRPILILHSPGPLLTLLGFSSPITLSFILSAHGLSINPLLSYFITSSLLWLILTFLHHIMPMGLLFLSLDSFYAHFLLSRPIYLFYGPIIYCSCHSGLMVLLAIP